ncbi:MAG: DUF1173 family protein [Microcystis sp. LE19-12.2C]|nr:DUF1173 family protein [Microcystis sp. LE19-12.2C]MCZ8085142.1 DUF1173 family protein [Paracoccaceae bacterium]
MPDILLENTFIDPDSAEGQAALAKAYQTKTRPRCMCNETRPELYITPFNGRFILRRMPGTGPDHAISCPTFDPPEGISGLGPLIGSAISYNEAGEVDLKLDFPLTIRGKRAAPPAPPSSDKQKEASTPPRKLTLTSLLHFLWNEAELNRWSPGMEGKRSWSLIRHLLLNAAIGKSAKSLSLADRLFIPEPFHREKLREISTRHDAFLTRLRSGEGTPQPVGIVIAEYKSHEKGRVGFRFTFKHLPEHPFYADADLAARFERAFEPWLHLADVVPGIHLMVLATFTMARAGYPSLVEIALMPTSDTWIPFETLRDKTLLSELTAERRRFLKPMRFNLSKSASLPSLLLTDAGPHPVRLYLDPPAKSEEDLLPDRHNEGEAEDEDESRAKKAKSPTVAEAGDTWPQWVWAEGTDRPPFPPIHRSSEARQATSPQPNAPAQGHA